MGRSQERITPMTPEQLLDKYEREAQPKPSVASLKASRKLFVDSISMTVPIGRIGSLTSFYGFFLFR